MQTIKINCWEITAATEDGFGKNKHVAFVATKTLAEKLKLKLQSKTKWPHFIRPKTQTFKIIENEREF